MSIAYKGFNIWLADPTTGVERDYIGRFELAVIPLTSHFSFSDKTSQEAISLIDSHMDGGSSDRNITTGFSWHDASSSDYSQAFGEVYPAVLQQDISSIISSMPDSKLKLVAQNGYYAISQSSSVYFSVLMTLGLELYDDEGTFMGRIDNLLTGTNPYSFVWVGYVGDLNNSRVYTFRAYGSTSNPRFNLVNSTINVSSYPSIIEWFNAVGPIVPPPPVDPYEEGGTSGQEYGNGDFDGTSDTIVDSTVPTFSFANSGFCRVYNPSLLQLQDLANYMWTDNNFLQTILNHAKQLLENPIESIISLAMLPVQIPQGTNEEVKILFISTGKYMAPATTQYVEVDCGSVDINEYYGSALDYNPYTQIDLFLPFIGQVSLNVDEVMNHTLSIKYRIDIVSGLCVAKIFVDESVLYQFTGNCAIFMPLNSADFSSYLSAALTAATALVSAGAGVAAGSAAAGAETVAEPAIQTGGSMLGAGESMVTPQMALQYRVEESVRNMYTPADSTSASLGEMERKFIKNSAAAVMGSKISFEHASHLAGNSGILGVRRPYVIINRPRMCNPESYGNYNGRPSMMFLSLGDLEGYTEVQEVHLTGFSATNPELAEISKMLKGGVLF